MRSNQFNLILDRVAQLYPKSMDLSLGRINCLLDKLGNPQNKIKNIIHIAGTNGKGSTLSYIVSILAQAGFKVDSYISPHLVDFNERFRIGNVGGFEYIDDESLIELLNYSERVNGKSPITIFELITAAAFLKFSTTGSDFLILETGLGGRLDATNVIEKPLVSVITPIGLDHQQFLGNTLEDIAKEKAGIIKNGSSTVISKQNYDLIGLFKKFIKLKNNKSKIYGEDYSIKINPNSFKYEDEKYNINLPNPSLIGGHQKFNAATAIAAISSIEDLKLDTDTFAKGIGETIWPARLEHIKSGKLNQYIGNTNEIWLDGGHNAHAAQALAEALNELEAKKLIMIIGMLSTKDSNNFLVPFKGKIFKLFSIKIPNQDNSQDPQNISKNAKKIGIDSTPAKDIFDAFDKIKLLPEDSYRIIICGSLYLTGEIIKLNN